MFDTINLRGSVLEKKLRTEQELRKYQEQEKDQGLKITRQDSIFVINNVTLVKKKKELINNN